MLLKGLKGYYYLAFTSVMMTVLIFTIDTQLEPVGDGRLPRPRIADIGAEEDSPHYLIHTPGCTILDIDPDHPSIIKYKYEKPSKLVCAKERPITEDIGLSLLFYQERIPDYDVSNVSLIECYYEGVVRVDQKPGRYNRQCDKKWKLNKKIPIKEQKTAIDEEGILVTCVDLNNQTKAFYHNVHFFLQPRRAQHKRKEFKAKFGDRKREQLSVIVFGTDAVSRGNLRRHMPKTFDYLKNDLHVIDLQGFNKVADNTDPNLSAYLMGLSWSELEKHACTNQSRTRYDNCPLIWKDYAHKGYVTVYGEDSPGMGAFHYNKIGFCREPTDYYNRPYFYASDSIIGHNARYGFSNGKLCQGVRSSISLIHEYSLKVAKELKDIPYFGFYWTASATHDYLKGPLWADESSLNYLKKLKDDGYLDHTVLFFVSDHGLRWGNFRSTYAGMLEERMPYITITFPEWFVQRYPEAMRNFRINTRRLTASFDVYLTLQYILHQAYTDPTASTKELPHGTTLFKEIHKNRTCEEAGIPEHYCACEHTTEADPDDPHLELAAKKAIRDINDALEPFSNCVQLTFDKVLNGRVGSASNATTPKDLGTVATSYRVTFVTQPGGAMMEASLKNHGGIYELTADVSRVNKYGNQSHCITDQILRKYCYCKDMLHQVNVH